MTGLPLDPDDPAARAAFVAVVRRCFMLRGAEPDVLWHLARGLTANKEIGLACGRSEQSIKNAFGLVFRSLGAADRNAAVLRIWPLYVRAKRQGAAIAPLAREVA